MYEFVDSTHCEKSNVNLLFSKKQGCVPRLSILCYNDTIYLRYFRAEHTHIYPVAFRDWDIQESFFRATATFRQIVELFSNH